MDISFVKLTEHNIDFLLMEEIVNNADFLKVFTNKIGLSKKVTILSVAASKSFAGLGESDITVILKYGDKRHALLIEDKINAEARLEQYARYNKRGDFSIKLGEFDSYDVFIVAPANYLSSDSEANKYPNKVSYEELLVVLEKNNSPISIFHQAMFKFALHKEKTGYEVIRNDEATDYYNSYINYCNKHYSRLGLLSKHKEVKGGKTGWFSYDSGIGIKILHKRQGNVDLSLDNSISDIKSIADLVKKYNTKQKEFKIGIEYIGRNKNSLVLRIKVPAFDLLNNFNDYSVKDINSGFEGVEVMRNFVDTYSNELKKLLKK